MASHRLRTIVSAAVGVALALSPLVATAPLRADPPKAPTEMPDEASAMAAARRFGKDVEVARDRTETAQVYATPNGTLKAVLSVRPVRVRKPDGSWTAVDTALRRTPDGSITPVAAPLNARLSGGGSGPLLSVARDGRELSLGWPDPLPAPALAGDTATYSEVLPGVDLRVRLAADGFSKVLVVKSRQAAAQPALRSLRFAVASKGLDVNVRADGAIVATDPGGATVFGSGRPMMWDSSATPKAAGMPVRLAAGVLTVTPDPALLADTSATYPVFIDPSMSLGGTWTMINERHPTTSYWAYDRAEHAKVGYVEQAGDGWERYRSIFQFSMAPLQGKHIQRSWLSSYLVHSYSCTDTATDLHVVGAVGADTNWANHAGGWGTKLASALNSDCKDTGRYSEWGSEAVTSAVVQGAVNGSLTLGLRAADEAFINRSWKKFDETRTALVVEYNSYPNPVDAMTVENKPCATGEGRPYVGTTTPVLRARSTDPDGDALTTWFAWAERAADGSYPAPWSGNHQAGVPSGGTAQVTVAPPLVADRTYGFHIQVSDGIDLGPRSGWCEFTVDTTAPGGPPAIATADAQYPSDGAIHGGVGISGFFTFGAAGVADVAGYRYGLASPPVTYVAAGSLGGTATGAVTPDRRGTNKLYVQSVDRAGNLSPIAEYVFRVGSGRPPVGAWALDERTGTMLADSTGNGHPATLNGGTLGMPGRIIGGPTALGFNGSPTNYASTGAAAVPTDKSFSVAAWVLLQDTAAYRTAVAQDGSRASGFYLQYAKAENRWSFSLAATDTDDAVATHVVAVDPPQMGAWTHLVGTYDAATRKATLFVNGREAGSMAAPPTWNPTGPLTIGRARWNGNPTDHWIGAVADVRLWDRRIYPSEVAELADALTKAGEWRFEEPSGAAGDSSGYNRPLTLAAGTARTPGHHGIGQGLSCNGTTTGYGATTGPVVNTDQSFAVSAWVRVNNLTGWQTAVTADGGAASVFYLQYAKDPNRWAFALAPADVPVPDSARALSLDAPHTGEWTHLVGVYDAGSRQARLYVNGQVSGTATVPPSWWAGGVVNVCRARWNNGPVDYFNGSVDDVRIFAGVPTDLDIVSLYNQ
jgi:hypothetical protein